MHTRTFTLQDAMRLVKKADPTAYAKYESFERYRVTGKEEETSRCPHCSQPWTRAVDSFIILAAGGSVAEAWLNAAMELDEREERKQRQLLLPRRRTYLRWEHRLGRSSRVVRVFRPKRIAA